MNHYPLIRSLSIVNINGINARTLNLVNPHALRTSRQYGGTVSLLGNNGAGKTSLLGAFMFSQIPDIRYISLGTKDDFKVSTSIKDSEMFPRLGQPSIVALEVEARGTGQRHLYVVRAEKTTGTTLDTRLFCLTLPDSVNPLDCLLDRKGQVAHPVTVDQLRDKAALLGCAIQAFKDSNAYMLALFQDGILPRACQSSDDKYRLAQILHSAMAGRLDKSIEKHLSAYLMAHTRGNIHSVVNMVHESMVKVRLTQQDLESYQKDYQFFNSLLTLTLSFSANTWSVIEKKLAMNDEERTTVQREKYRVERELEKIAETLSTLRRKEDAIKSERSITQQQIKGIEPQRLCAHDGRIYFDQEQKAIGELNKLEPQLDSAEEASKLQRGIVDELERKKSENEESQLRIAKQLSNADMRYGHAQKMALQYNHAKQLYDEISQWNSVFTLSGLSAFIEQLANQEKEAVNALNHAERQLRSHQDILDAYTFAANSARKLEDDISPPDAQHWFMERCAQLEKWRLEDAQLGGRQQHQKTLQSDHQKQRRLQQRLRDAGMLSLPLSDEDFAQQLAVQQEQELHLNEQKEQLAQRQIEVEEQIKQLDIDIARYEQQSQQWHQYQPSVSYLRSIFPDDDLTPQRCEQLILDHVLHVKSLRQAIVSYETEIKQCRERRNKLSGREAGSLEYLRLLAADVSGISVAELYADTEVQDAGYFEAALGPLMFAILINGDVDDAARLLLSQYGEQWPLPDVILISVTQPVDVLRNEPFESELLFNDITDEYNTSESILPPWCVIDEPRYRRISQIRSEPVLGDKAREALIIHLDQQIQQAEEKSEALEREIEDLERSREHLKGVSAAPSFIWNNEPPLEEARRQRDHRFTALTDIAEKCKSVSSQWKKSRGLMLVLQECEPDSKILFRDLLQELADIASQITRAETAGRNFKRYHPLISQIKKECPLLREEYPENIEQVRQQVEKNEKTWQISAIRLRRVKQLDSVRAHLNPEYVNAQKILEDEAQEQTLLSDDQKRLEQDGVRIRDELSHAKRELAEKDASFSVMDSAIIRHRQNRDEAKNNLDNLPFPYIPGLETQLALQLTHLQNQLEKLNNNVEECNVKNAEMHRQRSNEELQLKNQNDKLIALTEKIEQITQLRNRIIIALKADGSYGELEPAMREVLINGNAPSSGTFLLVDQPLLTQLTRLAIEYSISSADPFMQQLTSCSQDTPDVAEICTTLYSRAVALFRRRARQDIQRTTQPRAMLLALSQAAKDAQRMLAETEAAFQMRRDELADALSRRINDEKRAISRLSAELTGIGFGQVASVRLEARTVKHFQDTLNALKSGGYGMDDLFSTAGTVTEALAGLYKKINQHEIDGSHLLDHRNYLDVKTLIQRRGAEQFELLNASSLSTGERIGSGLAVLIAVLRHWGRSSHGNKEPFTLPLVMDEVSRLDAASQTTVHELAVRTGCQMLVAAPETLGKITGTGYQLVRTVRTESTGDNGQSVTRHQVKITGIRDAQQLPFDVDSYLATAENAESDEGKTL
ncbi:chromosome partition protein MukB [Pectobacterium araliae]|uniref:Chromosome partition protein MukB n=1 Tax=Pectobacterium araliae TaxID=3073862 RepID=A0AAN0KMW1_9GAMM|nr:chromosome partition protein MukB [Pectobacterium sp. MAFF 302110]GKW19898.1 chromosome partition protein MukB [Pectobacterium carotovorum subsp. carotovorum]